MISRIRNRLRPGFILWIVIMWCLLMGEITWANLFAGIGVGLLIVLGLPLPAMPTGGLSISWGRLVVFIFRWLGELAVASVKVAWLALRPADPPTTAIVRVPMRVSNELVLYLATVAYNLQPGGAITDIDVANRMLTIHFLDAGTPAALEREIASVARLERAMIDIFEKVS
ncbi:Na+/H+ antiporter subunit E [Corynebacterium tapiri]|uniref:Na+/H+ antiporter subunit E n=1 Tax=Corynebacterium tapiri TaxID=1448266 RepID=A0A5C4U3L9_9CORY|nr:Na+/H+ antiporter subunit E [Corynebacterium tapiri]TNL96019.1 Na+/H+ antiporter subunit E [Corynebacterium tapiri]